MRSLFRTKPMSLLLKETSQEGQLKRSLRAADLIAIGIGCIIGVGIFILPGQEAAKHAGPGIVLSFVIAAAACACSALCYAELAAMIPVSGSAYTYGYATLGEFLGWVIGWDLVLEYMVGACLVAIGWSGYFVNLLEHLGLHLPGWITADPFSSLSLSDQWLARPEYAHAGLGEHLALLAQAQQGTIDGSAAFAHFGALKDAPLIGGFPLTFNLPAVVVVLVLTLLLVRGMKESARVNLVMVIIKVTVILIFIAVAVWHVEPANWKPFMPFGFTGVMTAAAIVFVAYIGFDAVSTTSEEAINPQRDLPIGIIGSLIVATLLYVAVAAIMTGVVPYQQLAGDHPVATVLDILKKPWASMLVDIGAITGITSVLLVLLMGQPRILFAMSRDGLLPPFLSKIHPRYRTPHLTTLFIGAIVAVTAAVLPINIVAGLVSIGTLFAFVIVCAGVIVLRRTRQDIPRPFKAPLFPVLPAVGIALCGYLMVSLPWTTWARFGIWLVLGLLVYGLYGYRHSRIGQLVAGTPEKK
jgi:APA family basic amino acid/polyamine antiporter